MGINALPARRWGRIGLVALLGLAFTLVSVSTSHASAGHAFSAKKRCNKKHRSASSAKKKCKKKKHVTPVTPPAVTPPAPPAPLALTASEVYSRVTQRARAYCDPDPACVDYGPYYLGTVGNPECSSKTTYAWTCYGANVEYWPGDDPDTDYWRCDFREVVERDGYNGIKSHQDLSFGGSPWATGWDCYPDDTLA